MPKVTLVEGFFTDICMILSPWLNPSSLVTLDGPIDLSSIEYKENNSSSNECFRITRVQLRLSKFRCYSIKF